MITPEDIINIAKLSKLHVNEDELDSLTSDMKKIIQFADEIGKAQSECIESNVTEEPSNRLREDVVIESFEQELILRNVDGGKDGFFCVKKSSKK